MSSNDTTIGDFDGDYTDWIEIYNNTPDSINLAGYFLSDDTTNYFQWSFPNVSIQAYDFLIIWATLKDTVYPNLELHTNFKISALGETISLYSPDSSVLVDQIILGPLDTDYSYGRQPDGGTNLVIYIEPSPGYPNATTGFIGYIDPPTFSQIAGFYTDSFYLFLSSQNSLDSIYYTLDGSEPTINSNIFSDSILVSSRIGEPNGISEIQTATDLGIIFDYWSPPDGEVFKINVVRARVIKSGYLPSDVITKSYLVDTNMFNRYTFPIISLNTDSVNLFDDTVGIYVPGASFDGVDHHTCNFSQSGRDWEKRTHIEFFEQNGELSLDQDIGIRIAGNASRTLNVKSLRLYARDDYGDPDFNYQFFTTKDQDNWNRITLRTAGNDCHNAYMRDGFHHYMLKDLDVDLMQYRPIILFINGEYWGIHNIRDRYSTEYIFDNWGVEEDSLDFLEINSEIISGDVIHYNNMNDFLDNNDMSDSANYAYIKTQINVENFIDYISGNLIICNTDWPYNNIRYWRKRTNSYKPDAQPGHDGRWRWMVYDTDYGFARIQPSSYNQIANVLTSSGYSTGIMRRLIGNSEYPGNQEFREDLLNKICDELNTSFDTTYTLSVIDSFKNRLVPEMEEHIDRWNKPGNYNWWANTQIETNMKNFARERPDYLRGHLRSQFGISQDAKLTLNVSNINAGVIKINSKIIEHSTAGVPEQTYPWQGIYFPGIPFTLTAMKNPGYNFVCWSTGDSCVTINVVLSSDSTITAIFEIDSTTISGLYINEFLAVNLSDTVDEFGGTEDWIELYNNGIDTIDIQRLFFTDSLNKPAMWQIPERNTDSTIIPPGEYLLLWADNSPEKGVLHLGFRLDGFGEQIGIAKIIGTDTIIIDTLTYNLQTNNISFGRFPDASNTLKYFENTTPFEANQYAISPPENTEGLMINEILPDNDNGIYDNYGEREDWIELYNNGSQPIDIGGLFLTDDFSDPFKFQMSKNYPELTIIHPGDFLLLWADNDTEQGIFHLNFKLSKNGEEFAIIQFDEGNLNFLDSKVYNQLAPDISYGRYTDGSNSWEEFTTTTPGYPNMSDTMTTTSPSLFRRLDINEIMTINLSDSTDNYNEYDDWIEIFNDGILPLDLGGLYISNNRENLTMYKIQDTYPDSTTIPAGGFKVLWADNQTQQGVLHLNINVSENGGDLYLVQIYQTDTLVIDSFSYGIQMPDMSYGRYPDGSYNLEIFSITTFMAPNITSLVQGTQTIELPQNWSIMSSFIDPDYPNFHQVFINIFENVIIVKNDIGSIYYPSWAINNITDMEIGEGYYVKMMSAETLEIEGKVIIPELTPLDLPQGWSLIGYIRQSFAPIGQMLNSISGSLILVKNEAGFVYWPAYSIDELGNLYPGKGYLIKLTNGDILTYPSNNTN